MIVNISKFQERPVSERLHPSLNMNPQTQYKGGNFRNIMLSISVEAGGLHGIAG